MTRAQFRKFVERTTETAVDKTIPTAKRHAAIRILAAMVLAQEFAQ